MASVLAGLWPVHSIDDKRFDGMTFIPWQAGRNLLWDVTVYFGMLQSWIHELHHITPQLLI